MSGAVVGVLGGSGGVGATSFAATLAAVAGPSVLVDLDVTGGGADVALEIEAVPGARWSGLHLAGGHLDPARLIDGLPQWGPVAVLAADVPRLEAPDVLQVLGAAAAARPVVVDLPRSPCPERAAALPTCDLVIVIARADVPGLVAAHATVSGLPELPAGVVLRRGVVSSGAAAKMVGCPLLGTLPPTGGRGVQLDPYRLPRTAARIAAGILAGLAPAGRGRPAGVLP